MALIFYKNIKNHKKTLEKNIVFSLFGDGVVSNEDDPIAKPNECKSFYNLCLNDGALKTGMGFQELQVPANTTDLETTHTFNLAGKSITKVKALLQHKWYNSTNKTYYYYVVIFAQDNKFYYGLMIDKLKGMLVTKSSKMPADVEPTFICNYRIGAKDSVLAFTDSGMLYISPNLDSLIEGVPALISCVVHYDNFFGITNTNRNTLIYKTNLDLTNWTDEENSTVEFLDQRGVFTKVISFNDYVYLFREYGITKISVYTNKDDFSYTHLYTSTSKIYEKSVCICGDRVLFFTRDGLYSFTGNTVSKICKEYDNIFQNLDNSNCSCACLDGKYYFATRYNFNDSAVVGCESEEGYVNNVLFEIDLHTLKVNIMRGVDVLQLLAIDNPYYSKLSACFNGTNCGHVGELTYDGKLFGENLDKSWTSFSTDLGYKGKKKKIKEIIINTLYPCKVEISSDEESKTFEFDGKNYEQRKNVSVYGKNFQIAFKSENTQCQISKPMLVFDLLS